MTRTKTGPSRAALVQQIRRLSKPMRPNPTGTRPRATRLPGIRAMLFDVYGTLFVSRSGDIGANPHLAHSRAFAKALADGGFIKASSATCRQGPDLFREAILRSHRASRARGIDYPEVRVDRIWTRVLRALARQHRIRGSITPAAVLRVAVSYECRTNPVWPMPGLAGILTVLQRSNLKLGIVSNAQSFTALLFDALLGRSLASLGFSPNLCVWSYRFGHGKPSPILTATALQRLKRRHGIRPREVLYVGNDMLKDILPAARLGCRTALFAGDKRSLRLRKDVPACRKLRPDAVITQLDQLQKLLGAS